MPPPKASVPFTRQDGISLRDYVDTRVEAIEKATELAARTLGERLEGMNQIRDQLRDQAVTFATREQVDLQIARIDAALGELNKYRHTMEGKASQQSVMITLLVSVAALALSIVRWLVGG